MQPITTIDLNPSHTGLEQPILNRAMRRNAKKNIKTIQRLGTPDEKLTLETMSVVERQMAKFGNTLSDLHRKALFSVCSTYSKLLYGVIEGRFVVPLDAGMGKTLSALALCTAMHNLNVRKSIMICQSKVSELCILHKALVDSGIPEEKIGIVHSFRENLHYSVVDGEVIDLDGNKVEGFAAVKSIDKSEIADRQFLLVCHNRVIGNAKIMSDTVFDMNERNLVIWDESAITTTAKSIELSDIEGAYGIFHADKKESLDEYKDFIHWMDNLITTLKSEADLQDHGRHPRQLWLPQLNQDQAKKFNSYVAYARRDKRTEWRKDLELIISMANEPVRVTKAGGKAVMSFTVTIPDTINRMCILDASYPIRELVKRDEKLRMDGFFQTMLTESLMLKSYEDVTLHRMHAHGSRDAAEDEVKSLKMAKEVVEVVKTIPEDEGICIFTFLPNPPFSNQAAQLKTLLASSGVDLAAKVKDHRGIERSRFAWRTWGQETGSNTASYTKNVILMGVLRRKRTEFHAASVGQSRNLTTHISSEDLSRDESTELTHYIYQASLRSCARLVSDGKALRSNIWLFLNDSDVEQHLSQVMRKMVIKEWIPKDQSLLVSRVQSDLTKRILVSLDELLTMDDIQEISSYAFKDRFGFRDEAATTFTRAVNQIFENDLAPHWIQEGRSFKKIRMPDLTA